MMLPQLITAALTAFAVSGHPDAALMKQYADSARVPVEIVWAIAEVESGHKANNLARGADGEVGRFQLKPFWGASFRSACGSAPVTDYQSNLCRGPQLIRWCYNRTGSWGAAIACFNGRGPAAQRYRQKVEAVLGKIYLRELGYAQHS